MSLFLHITSCGVIPTILRPTKLRTHSETLIDNILPFHFDLNSPKHFSLKDPLRHIPILDHPGLPSAPTPIPTFDSSKLKYEDFQFPVYKKCPHIASFLLKIFKACQKKLFLCGELHQKFKYLKTTHLAHLT